MDIDLPNVPVSEVEASSSSLSQVDTGNEPGSQLVLAEPVDIDVDDTSEPFYLRYYAGHKGKFGHEFIEFDVQLVDDNQYGALRYANNSKYRNDSLIKKEVPISLAVVKQIKKIISESDILMENDKDWPEANRDGKQELEIKVGKYHISFETCKIGSLNDTTITDDEEGLRVFHFLVQDLKALVFSLVSLHFKVSIELFIELSTQNQ